MASMTVLSNMGVVTSVRGSVVDIRFESLLPPIRSLLRTGINGEVAIEVMTQLDAHSVRCILRKLSSNGAFAEHEGAFIPSEKMGGFSARELLMLRTIHECMLERGLRFSRTPAITVKKRELELALFRGRASLLSGIGKACRAVVFESREELGEFIDGLAAPGFENSRIRLALDNDKVVFVVASRNGIGGILP